MARELARQWHCGKNIECARMYQTHHSWLPGGISPSAVIVLNHYYTEHNVLKHSKNFFHFEAFMYKYTKWFCVFVIVAVFMCKYGGGVCTFITLSFYKLNDRKKWRMIMWFFFIYLTKLPERMLFNSSYIVFSPANINIFIATVQLHRFVHIEWVKLKILHVLIMTALSW